MSRHVATSSASTVSSAVGSALFLRSALARVVDSAVGDDTVAVAVDHRHGAVDEIAEVVREVVIGAGDESFGGVIGVSSVGHVAQHPPPQRLSAVLCSEVSWA